MIKGTSGTAVIPSMTRWNRCRYRCRGFAAVAVLAALVLASQFAAYVLSSSTRRNARPCLDEVDDSAGAGMADRLTMGARELEKRRMSQPEEPKDPIAAFTTRVSRYIDDAKIVSGLSMSQFMLDEQLSAARASLKDPTSGPSSAGQQPPPNEDDTYFPEPSTFTCRMLPDGFEVCEYENVCFDLPGPALASDNGPISPSDNVYFVGSDVVPSILKDGDHAEQDRTAVVLNAAPPQCRGPLVSFVSSQPGSVPLSCLRWLRHWLRLYPEPDNSIPWRTVNRDTRGFDSTFEDIERLDVVKRQRIIPFGTPLLPAVLPPNETVSVAHGGAYPGIVTWVENLYIARDTLEAHLWGWSQSVATPILAAHWANISAAWGLPPIDNLIVYGTPGWKKDRLELSDENPWLPHRQRSDGWAVRYLHNALQYVQSGLPPWRGVSPPNGTTEQHPWLDALVGVLGAQDTANATHVPLPVAIPYGMALLKHPRGAGTRIIYSVRDVPLPPDFARGSLSRSIKGEEIMIEVPQRVLPERRGSERPRSRLHTGLRRICGRRAVAVGQKPLLVSGAAESNAFLDFAYSQLGVPRSPNINGFPRRRATVVDRGTLDPKRTSHESFKIRSFSNLPEMLAILKKYDIEVDVVTDADLTAMTFEQQAGVFGKNGLLIMAHGAGLSNAFTLPKRSCVIEVYPRGLWCDLYRKMLTAQGAHVIPIYSTLVGPKVDWMRWQYVLPAYNKSDPGVAELARKCEAQAMPLNARDTCWREYRDGAIYTPLAEFERAVMRCSELLGTRTFPRYSPVDMVEGVVQNGPGPLEWEPGLHEAHQWVLCPPPAAVRAAGGRTGTGPHRCMFPNGTWLEGLPGVPGA